LDFGPWRQCPPKRAAGSLAKSALAKGKWTMLIGIVLGLVSATTLITSAPVASAAEIFPGSPLRWSVKSGTLYYARINGDLLASGSVYRAQLTYVASTYQATATKVAVGVATFSVSTVDYATATTAKWASLGGTAQTAGITVPTDTNGRQIYNSSDAKASTGRIKYAAIYLPPTEQSVIRGSTSMQRNVAMHELGHVYGMGHVNSTASIMYPNVQSLTTLGSSDITVLNSFYK